jgi:hypothetical protein
LTIKKPQTTTLIDTFSEGYAAINRRPWLLLLPLLLNAYIWFGTQLSFAPLLTDLSILMRLGAGAAEQSDASAQWADRMRMFGALDMRPQLALLNFVPMLTMYAISSSNQDGTPAGFTFVQEAPLPLLPERLDTIKVYDIGGALLALALLNGLALPLSAMFLTQVAAAVRGDQARLPVATQRAWRAMLAILGKIGVMLGVGLALGLPFIFLVFMLAFFSQALGEFMIYILQFAVFWISIFLGFANEAIVVSGVGPLRALHASFNIVRRNFWGTIGFLALSALIGVGSGMLWLNLAKGSTVGLIVAITGSAYLGSGLLAARMAFYRERLRRWQSAVTVVRTT